MSDKKKSAYEILYPAIHLKRRSVLAEIRETGIEAFHEFALNVIFNYLDNNYYAKLYRSIDEAMTLLEGEELVSYLSTVRIGVFQIKEDLLCGLAGPKILSRLYTLEDLGLSGEEMASCLPE